MLGLGSGGVVSASLFPKQTDQVNSDCTECQGIPRLYAPYKLGGQRHFLCLLHRASAAAVTLAPVTSLPTSGAPPRAARTGLLCAGRRLAPPHNNNQAHAAPRLCTGASQISALLMAPARPTARERGGLALARSADSSWAGRRRRARPTSTTARPFARRA